MTFTMKAPAIGLALTLALMALFTGVEGRRRSDRLFGSRGRGGGSGRARDVIGQIFGNADWFEASGPDDTCENRPSDDTTTTTVSPDGTTVASEFDQASSANFVSLRGLEDVCVNAQPGETKCICVQRRRFFFFSSTEYRLKCGTCQMTFVPDRSRSSALSYDEAIIELDDEPRDEDDRRGDRYSRERTRERFQ